MKSYVNFDWASCRNLSQSSELYARARYFLSPHVSFVFSIAFALCVTGFPQTEKDRFKVFLSTSYVTRSEAHIAGRVADKYVFTPLPKTDTDGFQVGAGIQMPLKRGYFLSDLRYTQILSRALITNLKPWEELAAFGSASLGGMVTYQHRIFQATVSRGFVFWKNFFVEPGLALALQLPDKGLSGFPDSHFQQTVYSDAPNIEVFRLADHFNRWLYSFRFRAGYQFGPLSIFVAHERFLSRMSQGTEYQGVFYPIDFRVSTNAIGLTYNILQFK
jgi:hypothetical protein